MGSSDVKGERMGLSPLAVQELAKEFRRLAAEQRVKSTNERYAAISQFKAEEAAATWEQAAQMLEEKLS